MEQSISFILLPQVSSDPFRTCTTPTIFAVGTEGILTSVDYVEVSTSLLIDTSRVALCCLLSLCSSLVVFSSPNHPITFKLVA